MGLSGGNDEQVSRPEPLTAAHDLAAFACGAPTLDDWLRQRAVANQLSGVSRSYVLIGNGRVAGYYTLAAGAIAITEAPGRVRRNSPDPIPMAVLGRLAIDQAWQGRGFGHLLLRDAVLRTRQAAKPSRSVGFWCMLYRRRPSAFTRAAGFASRPPIR
jgi:GNAT superfamily N-acetyltransferase